MKWSIEVSHFHFSWCGVLGCVLSGVVLWSGVVLGGCCVWLWDCSWVCGESVCDVGELVNEVSQWCTENAVACVVSGAETKNAKIAGKVRVVGVGVIAWTCAIVVNVV